MAWKNDRTTIADDLVFVAGNLKGFFLSIVALIVFVFADLEPVEQNLVALILGFSSAEASKGVARRKESDRSKEGA